MAAPRPSVDLPAPPEEFDAMVEWLEGWSHRLVLLEAYPLADVRRAVDHVVRTVTAHLDSSEASLPPAAPAPGLAEAEAVLRSDHARFRVSVDQLQWFLRVVEGEDHGGHRQALGQYGRVLAESLRRHRDEERSYLAASARRATATASLRSTGKP